ncbi:MAG: hypothetical protein ACT4OX_10865 [Actinomycetota bacterium]
MRFLRDWGPVTKHPTADIVSSRVADDGSWVTVSVTLAEVKDPNMTFLSSFELPYGFEAEKLVLTIARGAVTLTDACGATGAVDVANKTVTVRAHRWCFGADGDRLHSIGFIEQEGATSNAQIWVDYAAQWSEKPGYRMITARGDLHAFNAHNLGSAPPASGTTVVDIETTPVGYGYLTVTSGGVVTAKGTSQLGNASLRSRERATAISATPSGNGYWVFTDTGRALVFGDARHFGDMSGSRLNGPVLDAIPTPTGLGYYMVASDGGIFAFGDARFYGSMGGTVLNAPVRSLVPDPDGVGYWLVASDGGVFAFEAGFRGSMGGVQLNKPVAGMVSYGNGYLMVGEDGGIFNFSDQPFVGSLGSSPPSSPVVSFAAA